METEMREDKLEEFSNGVKIIPAIIPESLEHLRTKLLPLVGLSSTIQIDITDGVFVGTRSWPMNKKDRREFAKIVDGEEGLPFWEDFNFEIDMMVHHPETFIEDWIKAGAGKFIFHLESEHNFSKIKEISNDVLEIGMAIQNKTNIGEIEKYITEVDYIQVMGTETLGRQGEPFYEETLTTVKNIRAKYPDVTIQIDGGVDDCSAPLLIEAGANRLVSGSFILKSEDPRDAIERLKHGTVSK